MGTTLTGLTPATTYDALIKVGDNGPLSATAKYVGDGLGNDSILALSTNKVGIGTFAPSQPLHVNGNMRLNGALYDNNNLAGTSGQILSSTGTATNWIDVSSLGVVDGSGTANYVSKWSDPNTLTNSIIYDNGSAVGIGTTSNSYTAAGRGNLNIAGSASAILGFQIGGAAKGYVFHDSTNLQLWNEVAGDLLFGTNAAERVRITSTGNVGIGTSSPTEKLDVIGGALAAGNGTIRTGITYSSIGLLGTFTNHDLGLITNGTERMRITSAGNVGIGTSSPNAVLDVAGVAKATFSVLTSENSISSAAEASRFFAVSGDTGSTSYNGTSIGQAGISGFGSTGIFVVGGFKPILPKGWTGTVVLEAVCNNVNFATQVFIQTSTDGSSWTTQASASVNGTLTYTASSGLSADTFLRIVLSSGSGAPVSESVCQFSNLRINSYNVLMDAFHQGQIKYPSLGIASLSGGLAFNGDTAAANALDDYEEGTWTMGISFGGASTGVAYSNRTGSYTKIGRQVTVSGYANLTSKGSSTGTAAITGLPFTIGNSIALYSAALIRYRNVTFANQTQSFGVINTTTIELEEITEAGAISTLTNADFANDSEILISFTYFV